MPVHNLTQRGGSGQVSIPKDDLRQADLLDGDDIPDEQRMLVESIGDGVWIISACDQSGDTPDLEELPAVQAAAYRLVRDMMGPIQQESSGLSVATGD